MSLSGNSFSRTTFDESTYEVVKIMIGGLTVLPRGPFLERYYYRFIGNGVGEK